MLGPRAVIRAAAGAEPRQAGLRSEFRSDGIGDAEGRRRHLVGGEGKHLTRIRSRVRFTVSPRPPPSCSGSPARRTSASARGCPILDSARRLRSQARKSENRRRPTGTRYSAAFRVEVVMRSSGTRRSACARASPLPGSRGSPACGPRLRRGGCAARRPRSYAPFASSGSGATCLTRRSPLGDPSS